MNHYHLVRTLKPGNPHHYMLMNNCILKTVVPVIKSCRVSHKMVILTPEFLHKITEKLLAETDELLAISLKWLD